MTRCPRRVLPELLLRFRAPPAARGASRSADPHRLGNGPVNSTICPQLTHFHRSCLPCPPGRYCLSGASSSDGSGPCPPGSSSGGGATSPAACQPCECVARARGVLCSGRCLTTCSALSASMLSTVKECQEEAGSSLLPIIMGFSASGMAIVGKCSAALIIRQKRFHLRLPLQLAFLCIAESRSGAKLLPRLLPIPPTSPLSCTSPTKRSPHGPSTPPADTDNARQPSRAWCWPSTRLCSLRCIAKPALSAQHPTPAQRLPRKAFTVPRALYLRMSLSFTKELRRR